jgi:hypothetical protein
VRVDEVEHAEGEGEAVGEGEAGDETGDRSEAIGEQDQAEEEREVVPAGQDVAHAECEIVESDCRSRSRRRFRSRGDRLTVAAKDVRGRFGQDLLADAGRRRSARARSADARGDITDRPD